MSESRPHHDSPLSNITKPTSSSSSSSSSSFLLLSFIVVAPVIAGVILYQLDSFDPAPMPTHEFAQHPVFVPKQNSRMLQGAELIGVGQLLAPEDLAYDPHSGLVYAGCVDGWIKRVSVNVSADDAVVENWVNTGGRPLGLILGHNNDLLIADADKGLLKVTSDRTIELLTDEAEDVKFKLTDGVDITKDGMIYFTDASYKYSLKEFIWDILEGRPYGRFISYDPSTKETEVLVRDLYFANGVAISPDQSFVIFCESPMRRCKRYYIQGEKKGDVDTFIDNLPGMPDNIRYDGEGQYWIGLGTTTTLSWDLALRYPFIRKVLAIMERYIGRPHMEINGGFLAVDLEGKPIAHYYDPKLSLVTTGIKIADYLYCGSITYPYIIRLNLTQHPAVAVQEEVLNNHQSQLVSFIEM
ncbi:protein STRICTOSIDINE SYNTHASE-LIKE 5-like [Camellia sinensis]|uniref:protein STRICTOSIDINE SYNTHASE-LIKE 5-like n=1 Tax=Camellia sinensis TaxID=4442 RepID=UPI00103591EF|nr:protein STRICTOSIDINE SYNTHASE-LIKE 5-like [Camellia sinensis]